MSSNGDLVEKLSARIDRDSEEIQRFFLRMLKIKAVNPRMGGPGEAERAEFLDGFLHEEGFSVERFDVKDAETGKTRPNLCAKLPGRSSRNIWFVAHMDTVPEGSMELWKTDPFDPVVKDGKIYARGAEDNGQSLISSLFALVELKREGVKPPFNVGVWLVADEEYGSTYGVTHLLSHHHFRRDDLVVVPDSGSPDGGCIEIAEKGLLWFKVTTKGKQVHASLPSRGLNAHRVGIRLAAELDELLHAKYSAKDRLFDEPGSTFEPTMIEPNVANVNTIPGLDTFYFDCRVLPKYSLDDVVANVRAKAKTDAEKHGARIKVEVVNQDSAGPATSAKSEVASMLGKAVQRATMEKPKYIGIGGLTVGNLFRKEGIPTAVWSTIDDVAHTPNEYCHVKNLIGDAKVFASLPLF